MNELYAVRRVMIAEVEDDLFAGLIAAKYFWYFIAHLPSSHFADHFVCKFCIFLPAKIRFSKSSIFSKLGVLWLAEIIIVIILQTSHKI